MDELITWLHAQLDEDERVAQRACEWTWRPELANEFVSAEHIARWDPARVLVEVEANRRILDWAVQAIQVTEADSYQLGVEDVVRMVAQPYAGREGWREGWRA